MEEKPQLSLLDPKSMTFESVLAMFTSMAGRPPTEEEIKEARAEWDNLNK